MDLHAGCRSGAGSSHAPHAFVASGAALFGGRALVDAGCACRLVLDKRACAVRHATSRRGARAHAARLRSSASGAADGPGSDGKPVNGAESRGQSDVEKGSVAPRRAEQQGGADHPQVDTFALEGDYDYESESDDSVRTESPSSYSELQRRAIQNARMPDFSNVLLPKVSDLVLLAVLIGATYLVFTASATVVMGPYTRAPVDLTPAALPWLAMQSVLRMTFAYVLSLFFAVGYAYTAYRVPVAAQLLMIVIDVLQSIPLLSFVPAVVYGLIRMFPGARIGVELAATLLLFTAMVWNMILGFYQALISIPRELREVAEVLQLSAWKRFWTLEFPAGIISLVWNSIMSVAGGWFFLISIESFELGAEKFQLPGLGSFLAHAADVSDFRAVGYGLAVVICIIIVTDVLLWQPLIAWSERFKFGSSRGSMNRSDGGASISPLALLAKRSVLVRALGENVVRPLWNDFTNLKFGQGSVHKKVARASIAQVPAAKLEIGWLPDPIRIAVGSRIRQTRAVLGWAFKIALSALTLVYGLKSCTILRTIPWASWREIAIGSAFTLLRVIASLMLSMVWTVPLGVAVGRDPKLAARVQPLVQIAASVPATALFPVLLLGLANVGGGIQIGSVLLMMLGTCWFVLFNCIAGTLAIPPELFEASDVFGGSNAALRWRTLILPGIFPYLLTGVITAVGGAWNASIVSEYVSFHGGVLQTRGLGALISSAAAKGDSALLLAGTLVMSIIVLATNRFLWSPLSKLAREKYSVE
ncbi:Taurine transport system permease protein TauC [Porphyridium purpureum]|uniref:Taurine transport system permease protein TauC n=1 Tax=Porphyridium purpureum TaxID=35688 RepID=A0A5J4Z3F1_PORPP|nr:Taurine transport system permease protein TauC [Porphyridium purpureum]|eukprot:POR0382..scf295_1